MNLTELLVHVVALVKEQVQQRLDMIDIFFCFNTIP